MTIAKGSYAILSSMWSNLVVFHSEAKDRDSIIFPGLFHWKTCMRTVYIGDERILSSEYSTVRRGSYFRLNGYEAYAELLRIVSGIKSKLLGETEVFAQFKERFKNENLPDSALGHYIARLRDQLIEDSRKIRSGYLRNLGDQSYGGIAYRYLKSSRSIAMFGSGQLAEQMLPWLLKTGAKVRVIARNSDRLKELQSRYKITTALLSEYTPEEGEDTVIAAPFSLERWIPSLPEGARAIDFREDDTGDFFPDKIKYVSFAEILHSLKENERRNAILRQKLESVIQEIIFERENICQNFIYGWEDIPCLV